MHDTDTLTDKEIEDIVLAPHKPFLDKIAKENAIEEGTYAFNLKELLDLDLNVENILDPILPAVGLAWIQGLPDGGKSTFARELAVRLVLNSPEFLGMKLETVSRMLSKFQRKGLVAAQGKQIRIVDPEGLRQI